MDLINLDESVVQAYLDKITPFYQKLSKMPADELGHQAQFVDEILLRIKSLKRSLKMHRQFDNDLMHLLLLERQIDSWVAEEVKPIIAEWMKRRTKLARSSTVGLERLKSKKDKLRQECRDLALEYGHNAKHSIARSIARKKNLSKKTVLRYIEDVFTHDNNDDEMPVQVESILHKQTLEQFRSKVVPIPSPIAKFLTFSRQSSGRAEVKLIRYRPRQKMEAFKRNVLRTVMRLIRENGGPDTPLNINASFDPPYQIERNE